MRRKDDARSITARLRSDVLDDSVKISALLRRAKVLAAGLKHDGFRSWVDAELFGYKGDVELPDYRVYRTQSLGHFLGPFQGQIKNFVLPVYNLPDELREFATEVRFGQPVGELEALARKGQDVDEPWPSEAILLARDKVELTGGYVLIAARKPIPCYVFEGIAETVRNKLLEFTIELQSLNPELLLSDDALGKLPANDVSSIFITTINGGQNVVSQGDGNTQTVMQTVDAGDFASLRKYLHDLGVPSEDVDQLDQAIREDGERTEHSLGSRVKGWLGQFTQKAIDGAFKVAVSTAVPLAVEAIRNFYGWT